MLVSINNNLMGNEIIDMAINKDLAVPKDAKDNAKQYNNWQQFLGSEWSQLNKQNIQGTFGNLFSVNQEQLS